MMIFSTTFTTNGQTPSSQNTSIKFRIDTTYVTSKNNTTNKVYHTAEAVTLKALSDYVLFTHNYDSANFADDSNIYNSNGTITGNRTVDGNKYSLLFGNLNNMSVRDTSNREIMVLDKLSSSAMLYINTNDRQFRMGTNDGNTSIGNDASANAIVIKVGGTTYALFDSISNVVNINTRYDSGIHNIPIAVSYVDTTGLSGAVASLRTYTSTRTGTYKISGYLNVTAILTDVVALRVVYTDENSNLQTVTFTNVSTVSDNSFSIECARVLRGTPITVSTVLTTGGGTIAYDAGCEIIQKH